MLTIIKNSLRHTRLLLPIATLGCFDSGSPFFQKNDQIGQILVRRQNPHLDDIFHAMIAIDLFSTSEIGR